MLQTNLRQVCTCAFLSRGIQDFGVVWRVISAVLGNYLPTCLQMINKFSLGLIHHLPQNHRHAKTQDIAWGSRRRVTDGKWYIDCSYAALFCSTWALFSTHKCFLSIYTFRLQSVHQRNMGFSILSKDWSDGSPPAELQPPHEWVRRVNLHFIHF